MMARGKGGSDKKRIDKKQKFRAKKLAKRRREQRDREQEPPERDNPDGVAGRQSPPAGDAPRSERNADRGAVDSEVSMSETGSSDELSTSSLSGDEHAAPSSGVGN